MCSVPLLLSLLQKVVTTECLNASMRDVMDMICKYL
jgi:hypothetical protein